MSKKLKVYGWTGWRQECPTGPNGNRQTREVVAASSKKAVREIAGKWDTPPNSELTDTGNEDEIKQAMSEPGVVFWHPIDEVPKERTWKRT